MPPFLSMPVSLFAILASAAPEAPDLAALAVKAEKGDAEAQVELGRRLAAGDGLAKDEAAAVKWWLKAAARGNTKAEVSLGSAYANGAGAVQDWGESIRWFRKAALKGDPNALHNLGLGYAHGHGVTQDLAAAARWYRLAADQGHARAQFDLGELYGDGRGVGKSDAEAYVLYSLAAAHEDLVRIFGEAKAKEVVAQRDAAAARLTADQRTAAEHRIAAAATLAEVHPRRFGTAANVEKVRGWYIWRKWNSETWEAAVSNETTGDTWNVRVLPWATTYRRLNYGARPDDLIAGERVNIFFAPDENHKRGWVTHFQDEIGQMKGHGHAWLIKAIDHKAGTFTAIAMHGDKAVDARELSFEIDSKAEIFRAAKSADPPPFAAGDKVCLTWALRGDKRIAFVMADDTGLEVLRKEEAARLDKRFAEEGVAGQVQTVEGGTVHLLVFATHWAQAGRIREKTAVRLTATGPGLRPAGSAIEAEVTFRANRGTYGSGPTDMLLKLKSAEDGKTVAAWADGRVVRLIASP